MICHVLYHFPDEYEYQFMGESVHVSWCMWCDPSLLHYTKNVGPIRQKSENCLDAAPPALLKKKKKKNPVGVVSSSTYMTDLRADKQKK